MTVVALLPMKAGSERIANKNFRPFVGKPLHRWILDVLLSLKQIEAIVINTDADRLLQSVALQRNDRVVLRKRKEHLRGDKVSMNRILEDDIGAIPADAYLMTHATNPLLSAATISRAIDLWKSRPEHDSLFGVTQYQTRFYKADGSAINHDPLNLQRTQDLEPWFEENSNLYIFTTESFAKNDARIGTTPLLFETPKRECLDIDDEDDWYIAESIALRNIEGT